MVGRRIAYSLGRKYVATAESDPDFYKRLAQKLVESRKQSEKVSMELRKASASAVRSAHCLTKNLGYAIGWFALAEFLYLITPNKR